MIKSYRLDAQIPGPVLSVFGAVHGDEPSGTAGILRVLKLFDDQSLVLKRGSLIAVPVANPKAYALGQRCVDRNLNRNFFPKSDPISYEERLDGILTNLIRQADVHLDLHSYASPGGPFGFLGYASDSEIDFTRNLGINDFVYGWSEAFAQDQACPKASMGTVEYARSEGLIATTIESGQHLNEDGSEVAERTLLFAMIHLGMIDRPQHLGMVEQNLAEQRFVKMESVFYKQAAGRLTKPFQHLDEVKAGEVIAEYDNGELITAEKDGVIVLPKPAEIGSEWFYFGVKTPCPTPL